MLTLEEKNLIYENNQMLKKVCAWIDKHESIDYQDNEDFKNFVINVVANSLINPRR